MADNIILDIMTGGSTVATDNIGDVQHQLIKLEYGADGVATPVDATNPLPVRGISGTTSVNTPGTITSGTISVNTPGTITSGSINVIAATISAGTMQLSGTPNVNVLTPGTITSGSIVVTAGTVNAGTIGTVTGVGVVSNITNGTIQNSGTVTGVGTITNIGTIKEAGTVTGVGTVGTMAKVQAVGTLNSGTINSGTINAGTIDKVTMLFGGTINTGTINAGTINSGTINAGTINAGTIKNDGRPARNILSYGTSVTLAGTAYGTVLGSAEVGAGTSMWINEMSLINSGVGTSTFGIGFGTWMAGTAVLFRGKLVPGAGIQKSFPMPVNCGMTNQDLNVFTADAAGTVDVSVSYFTSA